MNTTTQGTDPGPISNYFNNVAGIPSVYLYGKNRKKQCGTNTQSFPPEKKPRINFLFKNLGSEITEFQIKSQIDERNPIIIDFQAWSQSVPVNYTNDWNDGHFNVLIGYDEKCFFFMDPSTAGNYAFVPIVWKFCV